MPLTIQQNVAVRNIEISIQTRYRFLLRNSIWISNDQSIHSIADTMRAEIQHLGGNFSEQLDAINSHYEAIENDILHRFRGIEAAIRAHPEASLRLNVLDQTLDQYPDTASIRRFLENVNSVTRAERIMQHAGFVFSGGFGAAVAEAVADVFASLSAGQVGLIFILVGAAYVAVDELWLRQRQIDQIIDRVGDALGDYDSLAEMRNRLLSVRAIRSGLVRLMNDELAVGVENQVGIVRRGNVVQLGHR